MNALSKTFEDLSAVLAAADRGNLQLDQVFWKWEKNRAHPIPGFEESSWKEALRAGRPGASLTTNPASVLQLMEETYGSTRIDTRAEGGWALAKVQIMGFGFPIIGEVKKQVPPSQLGLVLAAAFSKAHEAAQTLTLRLVEVTGVKEQVGPLNEWPIEQKGDKYFPVHHAFRLLGEGLWSPEKAREYAGMMRHEDHVMLSCRDRYNNFFGQPKIEHDSPSMDF